MNSPFLQLLLRWLVLALGVTLATKLNIGIRCDDGLTLVAVVLVLSFFNAILRPLMVLFTLPFILLTLGLGIVVINALLFMLTARLVDGFRVPGLAMAQKAVIGGDRRCTAVAAASILAKVTRDRLMRDLHQVDPRYGFDRHKGYATADHLDAVSRFGYSEAHRKSFRPPTLFDTMPADEADEHQVLGLTVELAPAANAGPAADDTTRKP